MKRLRFAALFCGIIAVTMATSCNKDDENNNNGNGKSNAKQITSFVVAGTPSVTATINESTKTITASMPEGTNLNALAVTVTVSEKATVTPVSGSIINFTYPVPFTVTAEDGSTATYMATITAGGASEIETLSGSMSANRTLKDLGLPVDYIINGTFYVNGNALLTIEPGVKILFTGNNGSIIVTENAGLKMVGTADKPIVFAGPINNPSKGSWKGIVYRSSRDDNQMEYVQLLNGGSDDTDYEAVLYLTNNARVSVKNCLVDGSFANGISVDYNALLTTFDGNTIKNCDLQPLWIGDMESTRNFTVNNTLTGNAQNLIRIESNTSIKTNMTLKHMPIPYLLERGVYVEKQLTIEPGTVVLVNGGHNINVQDQGRLVADGTAAAHITIRGLLDEAGYWNGIQMNSDLNGNKLNYCDISGGGKADGYSSNSNLFLWADVYIEIKNSTFSKSRYYGIGIDDAENLHVTHSNVAFSSCAQGNVWYENDDTTANQLP